MAQAATLQAEQEAQVSWIMDHRAKIEMLGHKQSGGQTLDRTKKEGVKKAKVEDLAGKMWWAQVPPGIPLPIGQGRHMVYKGETAGGVATT